MTPAHDADRVSFIGSIKWRETAPFGPRDLAALAALAALAEQRPHVPGAAQAALVAVAHTSCTAGPDAFYSAADLLQAWP